MISSATIFQIKWCRMKPKYRNYRVTSVNIDCNNVNYVQESSISWITMKNKRNVAHCWKNSICFCFTNRSKGRNWNPLHTFQDRKFNGDTYVLGIDFCLVSMVFRFDVTTIPTLVAPAEGCTVLHPLMTPAVLLQLQT